MAAIPIKANLDLGSIAKIVNSQAPVDPNDGASKNYVDSSPWKPVVRVAANTNIDISSAPANIDSIVMAPDDLVLLFGQTNTTENGIYTFNSVASAMTRPNTANTFAKLEGAVVFVKEGTQASKYYKQTAVNGTIGGSAITWTEFATGGGGGLNPAANVQVTTSGTLAPGADEVIGFGYPPITVLAKIGVDYDSTVEYFASYTPGSVIQKDPRINVLLNFNESNGSTVTTDESIYNNTFTFFGNAQVSTADPKFGIGALDLDGAGDYISHTSDIYLLAKTPWTIEGHFKMRTVASNFNVGWANYSSFGTGALGLLLNDANNTNKVTVACFNFNAATRLLVSTTTLALDQYYHIAVTHDGLGTFRLFIDGTQESTNTFTGDVNSTLNAMRLGLADANTDFDGLIDSWEFSNYEKYSSNFTAPVLEPTVVTVATDVNDADIELLLNFNGANNDTSTTDSSNYNRTITLFGDAELSTTQIKFGTTSLSLDGSGDYASVIADDYLGVNSFTIEGWVFLNNTSGALRSWIQQGSGQAWALRTSSFNNTGRFGIGFNSGNHFLSDGILPTLQWVHLAVTWDHVAGVLQGYVDGVKQTVSQTFGSWIYANTFNVLIGAGSSTNSNTPNEGFNDAFFDDILITRRFKYADTFTPAITEAVLTRPTFADSSETFRSIIQYPLSGGVTEDHSQLLFNESLSDSLIRARVTNNDTVPRQITVTTRVVPS